jgi:hypothetical protein
MKQKAFLVGLLVGIVLAASGSLLAQTAYVSGQDWNALPKDYRGLLAASYHGGAIRGIFVATVRPEEARLVMTCTVNWSGEQAQAVVDMYLRDNPQRWHERLGILIWDAFVAACKK